MTDMMDALDPLMKLYLQLQFIPAACPTVSSTAPIVKKPKKVNKNKRKRNLEQKPTVRKVKPKVKDIETARLPVPRPDEPTNKVVVITSTSESRQQEAFMQFKNTEHKIQAQDQPIFFLAFLEEEIRRFEEVYKVRKADIELKMNALPIFAAANCNIVSSEPADNDRQKYMDMRSRTAFQRELDRLDRSHEKFSRLVDRFKKFYVNRGDLIDDKDIVDAFKRESNDTEKNAQIVFCTDKDHCPECGEPYIYSSDESTLYCSHCSSSLMYIDAKPSTVAYGDQVEFSSFSYKRINHFSEYSNHLQARESKQIPKLVLRQIMEVLVTKMKITDYKNIDFLDIRLALKMLGARSYYDHVMQCWSRITGRVPLRLEPAVEELMHLMFLKIQQPWLKHRPDDRKNFLSYPYVFYKLCQLLGFEEMLKYFPLLKGRGKLWQQEITFKKICDELNWPWIPIEGLTEDEK